MKNLILMTLVAGLSLTGCDTEVASNIGNQPSPQPKPIINCVGDNTDDATCGQNSLTPSIKSYFDAELLTKFTPFADNTHNFLQDMVGVDVDYNFNKQSQVYQFNHRSGVELYCYDNAIDMLKTVSYFNNYFNNPINAKQDTDAKNFTLFTANPTVDAQEYGLRVIGKCVVIVTYPLPSGEYNEVIGREMDYLDMTFKI